MSMSCTESSDWNLQKACLECQGSLAPSLEIGSAQFDFVGMYSQKRTASTAKSTMWMNWAILSKSLASLLPLIRHIRLATSMNQKPRCRRKLSALFMRAQSWAFPAVLSFGSMAPTNQITRLGYQLQRLREVEAKEIPTESGSLLTLCVLHLVLHQMQRQYATRHGSWAKNAFWAELPGSWWSSQS